MTEEDGVSDPGEPRGRTIDGTPWEEPRPPHLPDPVVGAARRVPPPAWGFLALAIAVLVWEGRDLATYLSEPVPIEFLSFLLGLIPAVATCCFGAALFIRHPNARSTDPMIVFGIVLLVVSEAVDIGRSIFSQAFAPNDLAGDVGWMVASGIIFSTVAGLAKGFGYIYIARGLVDARSHEDTGGRRSRALFLVLGGIGTAAIVGNLALPWSRGQLDPSENGGVVGLIAVFGTVIVVFLAVVYLAATIHAGAAAGERPRAAWRSAAFGGWLLLLGSLGGYLIGVTAQATLPSQEQFDVYFDAYRIVGYVAILAYVLLLLGFALGLPGGDEIEPIHIDDEHTDDAGGDDAREVVEPAVTEPVVPAPSAGSSMEPGPAP